MSHKRLPDSLICEFTRYDFPLHFMQNMYLQWVAFLKKQPIQSINMSDTEKEIKFWCLKLSFNNCNYNVSSFSDIKYVIAIKRFDLKTRLFSQN